MKDRRRTRKERKRGGEQEGEGAAFKEEGAIPRGPFSSEGLSKAARGSGRSTSRRHGFPHRGLPRLEVEGERVGLDRLGELLGAEELWGGASKREKGKGKGSSGRREEG